ncbi:MAG: hypothetical protein COV46_04465 [Deltaproteobacteria bacterium CG11_big_fil_rev_8_21_14_0_20_49_13]|nr:MAG: hypothetical protein COV46_04465 [Deltaproteobacteria bacterium CG11_big_fil_rev_8_21_14_0_20_49_13]
MFKRIILAIFVLQLAFFCACSSGSETPANNVTAAITASTGIDTFTYHSQAAYKANFSAAGLILSGATSSTADGSAITGYEWEQISGPAVTVAGDAVSQTFTFGAPAMPAILNASDQYRWQALPVSRDDAVLIFRLTATDANNNSGITTFTVYLFDAGNEIRTTTGLTNVGVGEKVYLAGPSLKANSSTASTAVTDWTWTLTPAAGSSAIFEDTGNLNSALEIPNFTPDIDGVYTIAYTSVSAATNGAITVTASTYVGAGTIDGTTPDESVGQCGACHNGTEEPDTTSEWEETGHSVIFQKATGSYKSKAPQPYCWECHTVGYDTAATAVNGGFDDLVTDAGYSFPSTGTTWDQFISDNPTLAPLTNVQCENCHGPGADHNGDASRIAFSKWDSGICGKCHSQEAEWKVAAHNETGIKNNAGRYRLSSWPGAGCARCHTTAGFIQYVEGDTVTAQTSNDVGVSCQACHDPHSTAADPMTGLPSVSGNNSTQLRRKGVVTMLDDAGTQVDAGEAAVCYTCHDGYYVKGEIDCDSNGDGTADVACETIDQLATQYFRQIHHNPQSFVLEGLGAVTHFSNSSYDFTLTENSFHSSSLFTLANGSGDASKSSENNKCVTCHMGTAPTAEEAGYRTLGGHTWAMSSGGNEFTATCTPCHTGLTSLNRTARADYDGNGTIGGIQDENKGLLLALTNKIKSIDTVNVAAGTTQAADGTITVAGLTYASQAKQNASPIDVRRAVFDHNLIANDGSVGIHNVAFAVQLLQKTYTAISTMNGGNSFAVDHPNAVLR